MESVRSRLNSAGRESLGNRAGEVVRRASGQSPASVREGSGSLRLPLAGRVTANDVGEFLGVQRRSDIVNLNSHSRSGAGREAIGRGDSIRNTAAVSSLRTRLNDLNIDRTHINRVRTNVDSAFQKQVNVNRINNLSGADFHRHNQYFHAHPHRAQYWNNWGYGIRNYCNFNRFNNCFSNRFWATNYCHFPWRRSYYWWGSRPWSYWYGCPTWSSYQTWFPSWGWSTPYYYDYGVGGNVMFDAGYVYVNGAQVATAADYAASALELATVPPPANPEVAVEWLPLGTFALSTGEADTDPTRVVQLAVDKDGNISGTLTNRATNQTHPIQGRVDKETQRVAFTVGGSEDVVFETGIYNLTQQQTPVLAHGGDREETYLLYRLDPPAEGAAAPPAPPAPLLP